MKALVTGASGFVGRRVCAQLLSSGYRVTAPVRNEAARARVPIGVDTIVTANPLNRATLQPLLDGVETVIHLAARVHVMTDTAADPLAEFRRINVEGTRAVLEAAQDVGARQFIFLSSIKVNGENRDLPYTEADAPRPVDPYGQSKLDAEEVVRSTRGALAWTILRPPLVYGPEVGGNFRRLLRLAGVAARWPLPLAGIDNLRSMIFVENLASALVAVITHHSARNRTFLVSDDHDVGVSELLRRLAIGLGGRPRLFRAPLGLLRHAGALLGRDADFERLFGTLRVNCDLIQSAVGWRPPVELGDALGITARWWHGLGMGATK